MFMLLIDTSKAQKAKSQARKYQDHIFDIY